MIVKITAAIIAVDCIALILYFYDTIRLDFYYILAGAALAAVAFAAGHQTAKEKYTK